MRKLKPSKKTIKDYYDRYGLIAKEIWMSDDKTWRQYLKLYEKLHKR